MRLHQLRVERFRGIETLCWEPGPGLNCLIGPGNAGKSTVLAAIELLFASAGGLTASEYDYFRRLVDQGFEIHAVVGELPDGLLGARRVPFLQGWKDGQLVGLPDEDGAAAVLHVRARGTAELEVEHHLLSPSGDEAPFGLRLRRQLNVARLTGLSRAFNEFRLGRGTLLQRHVGDADVRGPLIEAVAAASSSLALPPSLDTTLRTLNSEFAERGLPHGLHLGMMSPRGHSLVGMVGLLTGPDPAMAVPYFLEGAGSRQLALFALARTLLDAEPLVTMDEPEHGLEPYRQRHLLAQTRELLGETGQAFLTTHSTAILGQLAGAEIHRLHGGKLTRFDSNRLTELVQKQPEAFLARLPVLGEGKTEAGLLETTLPYYAAKTGHTDLDAAGVHIVERQGQPHVLREAEALADAGVTFGLFVDAEHQHRGLRAALAGRPECIFGSWTDGVRNIEEAVAKWAPTHMLQRIVEVAAATAGQDQRRFLQRLGDKVGKAGARSVAELLAELDEDRVRQGLADAMQAPGGAWFKSRAGGRALGKLTLELGPPPEIDAVLEAS